MNSDQPLEEVMQKAVDETDGESVRLGELFDLYDDRTFGPVFVLLGLLAVVPPIGAIPGVPSLVGILSVIVAGQMLFKRDHLWLPKWLEEFSFDKSKLRTAQEKSAPVLKFIDRLVTDRLAWATGGPARYVAAVIVVLLGLMLIPLEVVPFAAALPGATIAMIGLGLLARDSVVMIAAYALAIAAFWVLFTVSPVGELLS
jgi:hypothetical protein